jgi:acyl-CoA synthetase (AMP-forming)/AMP-acid ligase II
VSQRWNLADVLELVADTVPERLALAHGEKERTRSFAELEARANALAAHWLRRHRPGDKVAIYSHNRPEFVESLVGALKARLVPVNVNYRYREEELGYLFENSDAASVVYEATFAPQVATLRDRLPGVQEWIELADGAPGNAFAEPFEEIAAGRAERPAGPRSPDDLILLYTGGTTGMPKGVMWTQGALWRALGGGGSALRGEAPSASPAEHRGRVAREESALRLLPACPLMHGTGQFMAYTVMGSGGAVVTLEGRRLDPHELWRTVAARRVQSLAIVGDAFAKPLLRALEERPGSYDLSSLRHVVSSGVLWSPAVKRALLEHLPPGAALQDSFGSSEAVGFGLEITTRDSKVQLGRFRIGPNCKVFTAEGEEVEPGSRVPGFIARSGPIPEGYYKDERKTAETFRVLQGRRWSIPGDWCTVNADGTLDLLGRGSVCINTGGEKVHPEEVEEALKLHDAVADAVVVGLADDQWGEAVTAVVELRPGAAAEEGSLRHFVRERLAGYKVPKRIVFVESVGRSPSGKADYKGAKARALASLGAELA